jgi:hypothetical protein
MHLFFLDTLYIINSVKWVSYISDCRLTPSGEKKGQTTIYKTLHRNLKIEQH